jgi:hypothetical protein
VRNPHEIGVSITFREYQGICKYSSIRVALISEQLRADYLQAPVNLRSYPPLAELNSITLPTFLLWRTLAGFSPTISIPYLPEMSNSLRVWILASRTRRSFSPAVRTAFSLKLPCGKQH